MVKTAAITHSPLAGYAAISGIQEIAGRAKIILRAKADDKALAMKIKDVLGIPLTMRVNHAQINKKISLLCLGPDEWMIWADDKHKQDILKSLQEAVKEKSAALVDVSDYYTIIRLDAEHSVDILTAACPLDLETIKVDECAQSHYANTAILLHRVGNTTCFDIQVRRSFADYLWRYFIHISSPDTR